MEQQDEKKRKSLIDKQHINHIWNKTEQSPIQRVMIRVINKIGQHEPLLP